jgi:catechol 2,3-dioxygenase-like lactoylglutathione lyase family enzyme
MEPRSAVMHVEAIDHVNIITDDLDGAARFYEAIFGLERRDGPPPLTPANAQWMYDASARPVIHLNTQEAPKTYERPTPNGQVTGAVHHVALRCVGHEDMVARLQTHGLDHRLNLVAAIGLRQIFVNDPNGVLFELNFFGD